VISSRQQNLTSQSHAPASEIPNVFLEAISCSFRFRPSPEVFNKNAEVRCEAEDHLELECL